MQHNPRNNPADGMSAEQVYNSDMPPVIKIIYLWEITQANYGLPEGEKAWDGIRAITDEATDAAIELYKIKDRKGEEDYGR